MLKKILGILSNVVAACVYAPISLFFGFLGLLFLTYADYSNFWTVYTILLVGAGFCWMLLPIISIGSIVLSIILKAKNMYAARYVVLIYPFVCLLVGALLAVVSIILGVPT